MPAHGGAIYEVALTHRSHAFEQPEPGPHNERLEWLGDAILGAIVTALIFRTYPDMSEGEMARLRASVVNTSALAEHARSLGLGDHLRLGKGEEASGGRDKASLLANTFEALVGAVYVDAGMDAVRDVLEPLFLAQLETLVRAGERYDVKTALQEVVVRRQRAIPTYRISSSGPDHDKRFSAHLYVEDRLIGEGEGRSKKEAEHNAARAGLAVLGVDAPQAPEDVTAEETGARAS